MKILMEELGKVVKPEEEEEVKKLVYLGLKSRGSESKGRRGLEGSEIVVIFGYWMGSCHT